MLGGMLLALALYFPGSHWIAQSANPALVAAQRSTPVIVETDPATCSVQFDPVGTAKFSTACDIAKSTLVTKGISYQTRPSVSGQTRVLIGQSSVLIPNEGARNGVDLKTTKADASEGIGLILENEGYPTRADPKA